MTFYLTKEVVKNFDSSITVMYKLDAAYVPVENVMFVLSRPRN